MIYATLVRVVSAQRELAGALSDGRISNIPRTVFVVGMIEDDVLAAAITDTLVMEIDDATDAVALMRFKFVETIGNESDARPYANLIALAQNRAAHLQRLNPSPLARGVR